MIVQRRQQLGFWTELIGIAGGLLGKPASTPQCPVPPPLEFHQTPTGLAVISLGAGVLGLGLGAIIFGRK